ncbi:VOC family protein [Streptomyces sp. NPDC093595]|uniref:VOC family protein n=1 Tax=Streptomyces sp. NPDC093595 TaxID=3366045 RepID=UPI00380AB2EC
MSEYPQLLQTVLDTTRPRELAEFYRRLLGFSYRPGDEPPQDGGCDEPQWLVLRDADGVARLAFQRVAELPRTTWPRHDIPMQAHLDCTVRDVGALHRQRARAESLGARLLLDRHDDAEEPLFVLADPSGHPFCIFVA